VRRNDAAGQEAVCVRPGPDDSVAGVAIYARRRLLRECLALGVASEPGLLVVGHVGDFEALVRLCELGRPAVLLADAGSDTAGTLHLVRQLRVRVDGLRVVMIHDAAGPAELAGAHRAGVHALIPSRHGLDALLLVIRRTVAQPRRLAPAAGGLTRREREILALVGAGHPVRRIAELLELSPHAVENAKRRIYAKLGVAGQGQAVASAAGLGLVGGRGTIGGQAVPPAPPRLTGREADVLQAIARGRTVRQTARELRIAEKTVENTRARLFLKLGAHNGAGAIAVAHELGLLETAPRSEAR
jgi:DNA-binding NarL/FixJ family response regulator